MKPDISISLAGIKMKNPVMNASGVFGYGQGFAKIENPEKLGAIITKTVTLKPRKGNPLPWMIKIEGGMMNSVGLANEGIEKFTKNTISKYLKIGPPIISSIAGNTIDDYIKLTEKLNKAAGISGIEVNTSCPNVHGGNIPFGTNAGVVEKLIKAVRKKTNLPIIVKLTPNVEKIEPLAKACEKNGADAISLINTLLGLAIDIKNKKPTLGGITGGISGPAIKNHALLRTWQVSKITKLPIVAVGGISCTEDALEFIMAGATAVAIGTANYSKPKVTSEIINGLESYLKENKIRNLKEIKGII